MGKPDESGMARPVLTIELNAAGQTPHWPGLKGARSKIDGQ